MQSYEPSAIYIQKYRLNFSITEIWHVHTRTSEETADPDADGDRKKLEPAEKAAKIEKKCLI